MVQTQLDGYGDRAKISILAKLRQRGVARPHTQQLRHRNGTCGRTRFPLSLLPSLQLRHNEASILQLYVLRTTPDH